jgi:glycerophosphoryl diester phosphodiesterase
MSSRRMYVPSLVPAALVVGLTLSACTEPAPELEPGEVATTVASRHGRRAQLRTIEDYLALPGPVAIAHRGFGANLGEDPSRPIENTVAAVRRGLAAGATIVEVDLQRTADGVVVVHHDDFFLPDLTCLNALTLAELQARNPAIPTLRSVLREVERFDGEHGRRGLIVLELKTPPPLCDPDDRDELALVTDAVAVVRRAGLEDQVMFDSFSPALLDLAAQLAPEIPTELSVGALQLLSPAQVEAATGLPVRFIDKARGLGLTWAEVGVIARLPGYSSVGQALATAQAVGARQVALDLLLLGQAEQVQPGSGAAIIAGAHGLGLEASVYTVADASQWQFAAALGADSIYADDVAEAIALQPALGLGACADDD